jgi:hypothetical protein
MKSPPNKKWIADRLQMGAWTKVWNLLAAEQGVHAAQQNV